MTKKKAIAKFVIICLCVALGVAAIFAKFTVPFTETRFLGFWAAIENKMGIDLKGGVMAVFDVKPQDGTAAYPSLAEVQATETRLLNAFSNAGLTEATVQRQGQEGAWKIRVEVPGLKEVDEIFDAIGDPASLDFRLEESATATPQVVAKDIKKVETYQNPEDRKWGVLLSFTPAGTKKFQDMVKTAGLNGTTYIYINSDLYSRVTVSSTDAGANGTTVITLGKTNATKSDAEEFKLKIESGLYEVKLDTLETSIIPQTLGSGALLGCIICLVIGLLFIFLFMWFRYGDLGLLSNLSVILYMVLFLFSLAVVDAVQLTLPGVAGIILALGMAVDANIIIFERIKDEYRSGKRLGIAMQNGFNKSIWSIFDSNITTIIGGLVLFFLGTGPIKGFAITLILGVAISMFCSLVVTRSFAKLYLVLNSSNANRLKLESSNPYVTEMPKSRITETPPSGKLPEDFEVGKVAAAKQPDSAPQVPTVAKPQKRSLNFAPKNGGNNI